MPPAPELGREMLPWANARILVGERGFELLQSEGMFVSRRRIFYDDVLLITHHVQRSLLSLAPLLALTGVGLVLALVLFAVGMDASGETRLALMLSALAAAVVSTTPTLVVLARGVAFVTIFGRRTRGRVAFVFRHDKALEAFALATSRVRAVQSRLRSAAEDERPPRDERPADDRADADAREDGDVRAAGDARHDGDLATPTDAPLAPDEPQSLP